MVDLGGVRKLQVEPAAGADLVVELEDLAAARAGALGLELLGAVKDHGHQAEERQHAADDQPEKERASLGLADDRGGEAEEEGD